MNMATLNFGDITGLKQWCLCLCIIHTHTYIYVCIHYIYVCVCVNEFQFNYKKVVYLLYVSFDVGVCVIINVTLSFTCTI